MSDPVPTSPGFASLLDAPSPNLVNCNRQLKELGIGDTITLPQICVIGDQSAGKSSLIHALSGVEVPRASGCCTQCPLLINLSSGEQSNSLWKCDISLIQQYDYNSGAKSKKPTSTCPLGPWIERPETQVIQHQFCTTRNKEEVGALISRAQLAILNPSKSHISYTPADSASGGDTHEVKFSPNIIKLDITQKGSQCLSFIDLPGVIANAGEYARREPYLVSLVTNLVTKFVKSESSICLLALPMDNDIANCLSMAIVQAEKAENRTVAVFTKSDRVQSSEARKSFLDLLVDENCSSETRLQYGYYAVMMKPAASTVSREAAIAQEEEFFDQKEWHSLHSKYGDRLGTQALSQALQTILHEQTRVRLPAIKKSIESRLNDLEVRLREIPSSANVHLLPSILQGLINQFADCTRKLFEAGNTEFGLLGAWEKSADQFRTRIQSASPKLKQMSTEGEQKELRKAKNTIARFSKTLTQNDEDQIMISDDDDALVSVKPESRRASKSKAERFHTFSMEDIRHLNQNHAAGGLPRQKFPKAVMEMRSLSVKYWDSPIEDFMEKTSELVCKYLERAINLVFGKYEGIPLYKVVKSTVSKAFESFYNDQIEVVAYFREVELAKPVTRNTAVLENEARIIWNELETDRNICRTLLQNAIQDADQAQSKMFKGKKKEAKSVQVELLDDEFSIEIGMQADVQAYYYIASARFVDNVCQSIYAKLFTRCSTDLATQLMDHLDPMDSSKHVQIAELMTENPERLRKRREFLSEQEKLVAAQELVHEVLGRGSTKLNTEGMDSETQEMDAPVTPIKLTTGDGSRTRSIKRKNCTGFPPPESDIQPTPTKRLRSDLAGITLGGELRTP